VFRPADFFIAKTQCLIYDDGMKKLWYAIFVIAIIYLGWEFFRPRPGQMYSVTSGPGSINTASVIETVGGGAEVVPMPATGGSAAVAYSANGFAPKNISVKKGDAVMWTALAPAGMWIASDMHPTHADYDGTDMKAHCAAGALASFDQCAASAVGSQWSFTFNKVGTWRYHDHINPAFGGTVTVTE
jgi:plastocyanin